jgi:Helicase conserved C-terminal domain
MSQMLDDWRAAGNNTDNPEAFIAHVKASNPDFARIDGRYDTWHIRDAQSGAFLNGFEHWDRVEGALIASLIRGPLTWLEDPRLPRSGSDDAPPDQPFSVAGDATITIANTLAFERFQLARVADWLETQAGAFVYHLTPRSLKRAGDQGIKAARVLEFLEQKSGKPPPSTVLRAIERWAERGGEARIEPAVLLRTKDAATLDALLKIDALKRAGAERIAPNCAVIRPRDLRAIRAAIAASGLLVDLSG